MGGSRQLDGQRALDLLRIVTASPQMLPPLTDRASVGHRTFDLRHVATLADHVPFLRKIGAFIFRERAAGSHAVKLERALRDLVAAIADVRGPEFGIELRRMGGDRIVERPHNHPILHMARGAGDAFLLQGLIEIRIRNQEGLFDPVARNVRDQMRLLIRQRRVTVQTDPDFIVLLPIGAEERVREGLRMIRRLPLLVDFLVTLAAILRLQTRDARRYLLQRQRMREILPQPEDHLRPQFVIEDVDEGRRDDDDAQGRPLKDAQHLMPLPAYLRIAIHDVINTPRCPSTEAARASR